MFNLVVGVTINTFNYLKETSGRTLLTDSQNQWLSIQRIMALSKIQRKYSIPANPIRRLSYLLTMSTTFDYFMIIVILANVISMQVLSGRVLRLMDLLLIVCYLIVSSFLQHLCPFIHQPACFAS